ncbi:MAG: hypothetical protein IJF32_10795 [Oscillospiraceae bacterium]|nr:hypothetical protein [Oscillospiraceae bacterium]MBQ7119950.1 hypothetical protein [Oscillospiraceae bacterium]
MKKDTKAAVVFISGQSNATAHQQFLAEEDKVLVPMKNVFGLDRNPNQSFDISDVVWSGWTSGGKNLGETQDHTASLAYFVAKKWQAAIDEGKRLPDLYIVQLSVGSQGIINGMWNRDKERVIKPGILGEADISLLPLALYIQSLALKNLRESGKNPEVIGWHWLGCEQEVWYEAYLREDFKERYDYHFDVMRKSMGGDVPTYLYKVVVRGGLERFELPLEAENYINAEIERQANRFGAKLIDPRNSPYWDSNDNLYYGILASDRAHYVPKLQEWFADEFMGDVLK